MPQSPVPSQSAGCSPLHEAQVMINTNISVSHSTRVLVLPNCLLPSASLTKLCQHLSSTTFLTSISLLLIFLHISCLYGPLKALASLITNAHSPYRLPSVAFSFNLLLPQTLLCIFSHLSLGLPLLLQHRSVIYI